MNPGYSAFFILPAIILAFGVAGAQPLQHASPQKMGLDPVRMLAVDSLINDAIDSGVAPGAVLAVVREDLLVYRRAYGMMQREPEMRAMHTNTIFDLASLTKPLATGVAIMKLVESGHIRLTDPVSKYVPEFAHYGGMKPPLREQPRIIHLLTHTSGLPSYVPVRQLQKLYGPEAADSLMTWLCTLPARTEPGAQFTYSCPSFITLQQVIEAVTGTDLATWTRRHIYEALGMHETFFLPDAALLDRIAPTHFSVDEGVIAGVVHDPLARVVMGGISGNAGLFSTADDLAIFAAMMLNDGAVNGRRLLAPATVRTMTSASHEFESFGRALGWDVRSSFASNRGDLFGPKTYGHTGYTGTSMILDPDTRTAVILLTNRVYPDDSTSVVDLRAKVANVVAASILE